MTDLVEEVANILRSAAMSYDEDFGVVTIDDPEELARAAIAVVIEWCADAVNGLAYGDAVEAIRKLGESE